MILWREWVACPYHRAVPRRLQSGGRYLCSCQLTPLAGIVFATEEISRAYESRTNGTIRSGLAALGLVGGYNVRLVWLVP
ncbi:hypothetical protein B5K06_30735 [Rhizobium grahamii]|uniref:Uncharacterized protein n=1 Tax=Rhizobium grahamii TaxID=1120045 RepID=A0A370KEZ7_9HYPH|nr:hypothetical protein B5K06_30735 [Rhizobium grahamii]